MLKNILSPSSCAGCRICCVFDRSDIWELPLLWESDLDAVKPHYNGKLIKRGSSSYVFDVDFKEDGLAYCPMLTDKGCILGNDKPYDCKIWPFRVNDLNGRLVITLSPVCPSVSELPLNRLMDFMQKDSFAEQLFSAAKEHPDMVKPYISGYPILAAED